MCNLYRMTRAVAEIANLFRASPVGEGLNFAAEIYPGYTGLVITNEDSVTAQPAADRTAARILRPMTWGFPLAMKGKQGQPLKPRPVNNAREDKLMTPFWRPSMVAPRRCLVPVSAWAEAEGEKGRMTRTWYALPHGEPFAVAGLWRPTAEWGDAYAMVMCAGCEQMADVHDRMPVILAPEQWDAWLSAPADEALSLCTTWAQDLLVERSGERWAGGG